MRIFNRFIPIILTLVLSAYCLSSCETVLSEDDDNHIHTTTSTSTDLRALFYTPAPEEELPEETVATTKSPITPPDQEASRIEAMKSCSGIYDIKRVELNGDSKTCLDGVKVYYECLSCHHSYYSVAYTHVTVAETIDLGEHKLCNFHASNLTCVKKCACGDGNLIDHNSFMKAYKTTYTNGKVYLDCLECALRVVTDEKTYGERDEGCKVEVRGVKKVYFGETLLASAPVRLEDAEMHDYEMTASPAVEGKCQNDLLLTYKCKHCNHLYTHNPHVADEKFYLDLSDYDICEYHYVSLTNICGCFEGDVIFGIGPGVERDLTCESGVKHTCKDCGFSVLSDHPHDSNEVCNDKKCFKFTVSVGDKIIAEIESSKALTELMMN